MNHPRRLLCSLSSALVLVGLSCTNLPSNAAEKITITYGPFGRSIAISDLRQYLETGSAPPELASLLSVVGQQERASLLSGLKFTIPLNVVVMDQLLRSPQGEQLLTQIAGVTSLPGGAEKLALRSALIVSAASKEGVGLLSFLEAYPARTMRVDIPAVQKLLKSTSILDGFMSGSFPGGDTPDASSTNNSTEKSTDTTVSPSTNKTNPTPAQSQPSSDTPPLPTDQQKVNPTQPSP
ncbi:MAG: alpha/beta hydrolase [Acaryochloris sp. RU_4_1]|nr:alpha/beta hydrolase [Acaryochloris sp. RU_4_1]NJR54662.1 alpha/beta hydrolase [Acaryochloris sp. CRU_2_0]